MRRTYVTFLASWLMALSNLTHIVWAFDLRPLPADIKFGENFTLSWDTSSGDPTNVKILAFYHGRKRAIFKKKVPTVDREAIVLIPRRPALPPGPFYSLKVIDTRDNSTLLPTRHFTVNSPNNRSSLTQNHQTPTHSHITILASTSYSKYTTGMSKSSAISTTSWEQITLTRLPTQKTIVSPTIYQSPSITAPPPLPMPETQAKDSRRTGIIFAVVFGVLGTIFSLLVVILLLRFWRRNRSQTGFSIQKIKKKLSFGIPGWTTRTPDIFIIAPHDQTDNPNRVSAGYDPKRRSHVGSTISESTSIAQERRRRDILSELRTLFQAESDPIAL